MMATIITILMISGVLLLLIKGMKARNTSASKLGILEHPSTFEKPAIEMVVGETDKKSKDEDLPSTDTFKKNCLE